MFKFSQLIYNPPINIRLLARINSINFTKRPNNRTIFKKQQPRLKPKNLMASSKADCRKEYCSFRKWKCVEGTSSSSKKIGQTFKVMSYNILAQDLIETHYNLYKNHDLEFLEWKQRIQNLCCEILTLRPDILCLQEMQQDHILMLLGYLKELHFNYVFNKNTGPRTDGCAILFNKNKFTIEGNHCVEYYQPNVEYLDRHNIALAAKLRLKANPKNTIIVVTTHLLYNPRRQDVRLAQIQVLLAEIDMLSFNGYMNNKFECNRIPTILTGDFNLEPVSAPYRLICNSFLRYNNLTRHTLETPNLENSMVIGNFLLPRRLGITDKCQHIDVVQTNYRANSRLYNSKMNNEHKAAILLEENQNLNYKCGDSTNRQFSSGQLKHNLNLFSVYNHKSKDGMDNEASTHQDQWINVDYIFYNKSRRRKYNKTNDDLKLISWYTLPTVQQCDTLGRIPNSKFGSDHLSLAAEFLIGS